MSKKHVVYFYFSPGILEKLHENHTIGSHSLGTPSEEFFLHGRGIRACAAAEDARAASVRETMCPEVPCCVGVSRDNKYADARLPCAKITGSHCRGLSLLGIFLIAFLPPFFL